MQKSQEISSQPISSEEFFQKITGLKPCLLLGNGISLYLDKETLKWSELLTKISNDLSSDDNRHIPFQEKLYEQYLQLNKSDPDVASYPELYTRFASLYKTTQKR